MSLFFPRLDIEATVNIYKLLLQRTADQQKKSKKVEFNIKRKEITKFARIHYKHLERQGLGTWNGRQGAARLLESYISNGPLQTN